MKKYPCYLQEGKNDCGAACIKSILNYYHGDYDYEKLKVELKLDNQGISAYHMIAFLNQNSFISEGKRYNWESFLKKTHLLPMIVVVKNESLRNHYIIIYKISKKKEQMIVGDPKEGIKTISFSQFQQIFTGITISFLLVEPIIQNATHSLSKTLFTFLIRNKKSLILLGSILFIYLFFQLITSFTMRYFIRGIEFQKDKMYFYMIFFTFLSFQWLQKIYEYYIEKVFFHLKIKLQKCLEHRFYFHLLSMDLEQICYSASSHFINKKEEFHIWFETFISFIQFCLLKIPFLFVLLLLFLILFRDFFVLIIFFTIFTILYFFLFYQMVKRKEEQIRTLKEKEMIYFADTTDNLS
ncbi:MAG: hypothetical protein KH135_06800, partial [Firmicutes bacterium]|nr:hypothetical protein [Bacillota bacterium]